MKTCYICGKENLEADERCEYKGNYYCKNCLKVCEDSIKIDLLNKKGDERKLRHKLANVQQMIWLLEDIGEI